MSRRGTILSIVFAVALLALPSVASAQSYAEAVWSQLNDVYNQVNGEGFDSRNYVIGRMANGSSDSWSFTLPGGNSYKIVGVCDNDCDDLDIEVSIDGAVIAEDVLDDDVPIVNFTATNETRYTVRVTMASCSADPCFWGLAVFYK
jgi:hypothetical protein